MSSSESATKRPLVLHRDAVNLSSLLKHFALDADGEREYHCILLIGGSRKEKLEFAESIARHEGYPFIKIDMPIIVEDHSPETIGNLREAFDTATKSRNVLYLDAMEAIVTDQEGSDQIRTEMQGGLYYLCERAKSYKGIAVMSVAGQQNTADMLCLDVVDAVVDFE